MMAKTVSGGSSLLLGMVRLTVSNSETSKDQSRSERSAGSSRF